MTLADTAETLAAHGFIPVPLRAGKKPFQKGWTRQTAEEALKACKKHANKPDCTGIGIRCDNLLAFDLDCDAPRITALFIRRLTMGTQPLIRRREGSDRALLLFQVPLDDPGLEKLTKKLTGRYEIDGERCQVELLAGPGFQFAAFGAREDGTEYSWDYPPGEYEPPMLAWQDGVAVLEEFEAVLAENGDLIRRPVSDSAAFELNRGLWGDQVFTTLEWGPLTVLELNEMLQADPNLKIKCHLDGIREGSDSGAGLAQISHQTGQILITDFVASQILLPADGSDIPCMVLDADAETRSFASLLEGIEQADRAREAREREALEDEEAQRTTFEQWLQGRFYDTESDRLFIPNGKSEGTKRTAVALLCGKEAVQDYLDDHPERVVDGFTYHPGKPPLAAVRDDSGAKRFNRYFGLPKFPDGGSTQVFDEHLHHLVDGDPQAVSILWDWFASLFQKPAERGFSIVLWGGSGSGKGSLLQPIKAALGGEGDGRPAVEIDMKEFLYAQYNDFLWCKQLVYVDEAAQDGSGRKQAAYERLKALCEPQPREMVLNRKYGGKFVAEMFSSVFITSNHPDAVPVQPDDRRFCVLRGTKRRMPNPHRYHVWAQDPRNIGALQRKLLEREIETNWLDPAPDTEERLNMALAGEDLEITEEVQNLLEELEGFDGVWPADVRVRAERLNTKRERDDFYRAFRDAFGSYRSVKVGGKPVKVYVRDGAHPPEARQDADKFRSRAPTDLNDLL